jgi:hypothetical protein
MIDSPLSAAAASLDACDAALSKLEAGCCDPGRSPSMAALAATLERARTSLDHFAAGEMEAAGVVLHLEDAGAQVGRLQVGCCTPKRLPLYERILEGLTTAQLTVSRAAGVGHGPEPAPDSDGATGGASDPGP